MAFVTAEEIQKAREIDAFSYLQAYMPGELVKLGNGVYCTKTHDSLKLSHGKWFWWSQGFGGVTALDYLVKVEGMDFVEAVQTLNSRAGYVPSIVMPKAPTEKIISIPPHNFDCKTARQYLRKRGIDYEVIDYFIDYKMLAEETKTGYCLFFGLDENGKPKYGSVRATDGRDFKKDLFGSDKKYAFGVCTNTENKCVRVFESAIDLMSFATLMKQAERNYLDENLISLAGVYEPKKDVSESKVPVALDRYLSFNPDVTTVILHFDRDGPGSRAAKGLACALGDKYTVRYVPPPSEKDFNDYLCMQTRTKEIQKRRNERA